jgi:predicted nucleic acid-binding protein
MPDKYTLDASVAAKWFNNESLTDKAIQVRDAFVQGKIMLVAPEHLLYEVGNAIWKNKALSQEDAVTAVRNLVDLDIELVRLTPGLAGGAMNIARSSSLSFYDAAYVILADHFDAPVISADSVILAKAKKSVHLADFSA